MPRICSSCEDEIPAKRLAAKPNTRLCVACQSKVEENTPKVEEPVAYVSREQLHSQSLAELRRFEKQQTRRSEHVRFQGDDQL